MYPLTGTPLKLEQKPANNFIIFLNRQTEAVVSLTLSCSRSLSTLMLRFWYILWKCPANIRNLKEEQTWFVRAKVHQPDNVVPCLYDNYIFNEKTYFDLIIKLTYLLFLKSPEIANKVTNTQTVPSSFGGVGRPDTLFCGSQTKNIKSQSLQRLQKMKSQSPSGTPDITKM